MNNAIKENEYRKEAGLNKDDDKNNKLLLKFIEDIGKLNDEKNFIEKLKNNVVTELFNYLLYLLL